MFAAVNAYGVAVTLLLVGAVLGTVFGLADVLYHFVAKSGFRTDSGAS